MMPVPNYLKDYAVLYRQNPRQAAGQWFRDAQYGLFLHYGLYSLLGRHEWVQLKEKIPVAEYQELMKAFHASRFDAEYIAAFARACGMKYVNITTRHHDSFCLWDSQASAFNSMRAPARRDLVGELAAACDRAGLGLCLYYSHGRDWRHPHAPNNDEWGGNARPAYDPPEPAYAYGARHDLNIYLEFMKNQIKELLTNYGPIAAIWLDGIGVPLSGDAAPFRCQELYDLIHRLQPQVLVSYKQGVTGTEDFFAPEHRIPTQDDNRQHRGKIAAHPDKIIEICTSITPGSWGYKKDREDQHLSPDEVLKLIKEAHRQGANLLLNTGPLPDGSIHPAADKILRTVGEKIRGQRGR
jgi:alpha-L-fucosidase